MKMSDNYPEIRFRWDRNRKKVWAEITRYLQKYIKRDSEILDLGAGYCDFINFIKAKKKYALDKCIDPSKLVSEEIITIFGDFSLIKDEIKDNSLDVVFASNFFEHLKEEELDKCIGLIKNKLREGELLIIIQPNYRFCYKNYFDDYTHTRAWTDISLRDYLISKNFAVHVVKPKFLPFSMKSTLPKNSFLVRLYLNCPIKPFASQMLIVCSNKK
jgi:hypothetical protein